MDNKIGKTIGNYLVEKELGRGQFGVVYLVKSVKDGSMCAIKCINKQVV
jgi:serine/threonine protein kinase